jgi:hypothetical protein
VAAANQIPSDSTFKRITKNTDDQDVLEKYSQTSSSIHGNSDNHNASEKMTETSGAVEVLEHQRVALNFGNAPSSFINNITVESDTKSVNNHTVITDRDEPSISLDVHGHEFSEEITKHSIHKDAPGVTSTSVGRNSSDKETAEKNVMKSGRIQDVYDLPFERTVSSSLVLPSGLDESWNQGGLPEKIGKVGRNKDENSEKEKIYKNINSSWPVSSSVPNDSVTQDPLRMETKPMSNQHDDDDDADDGDDSITTTSPEGVTTLWPEEQDSYRSFLLSSTGHYGESEQDSDRNLNWGGYEDWWAKTYANHRPFYMDEQLKLSQETEKQLPDSTSIWDMASFREYEDSNDTTNDVNRAANTVLSNKSTPRTEISTTSIDDYPSYQLWESLHKYHQSSEHSVKKANPQNLYNDKQINFKHVERVPAGSSIQDHLMTSHADIFPGADITTTESYVDSRQFSELNTMQSDQNITESTSNHSNLEGISSHIPATEPITLSTSAEFYAPSSAENIFSTENIPDQNIDRTDKPPHSESKKTHAHPEHSSEASVPLRYDSSLKRTDTQSLMEHILGTTTSTRISHETEICYRGRCIKTKTKDSDIDQFSTD